ncbi:DNA mismatch repair protein MutS2 [Porphyromonadaceae bacterium KH3R12]|uniref:endonuclease MutS2 n=1 Tax=Proteiniphilum sp. TaxID=1926877 RepID=UPI00089D3304|nr:endonuclease MutS2 [Proteiniphilum sp.]MDY9918342.1 endonuclease MutS2 [Proteiniphilum sp.]SDZ74913.1 DNA mismatch repair protein MutS2 [Porphyromonadaceae bacterium KH3R12]
MIYPDNFEQKIEFQKVRQLLLERCLSPLGKEKVEKMHFSASYNEIEPLLFQTEEFVRIREEEDSFPADHFYDMRPVLRRIRVEGAWIDQNALFELRRSLQTINGIVAFLRRDEEKTPKYPYLLALAGEVLTFPEITRRIDSILDGFGQVKDHASPRLSEIRRELTSTMNGISKSLNAILRKAQAEGYVDKDVSPSMRDGRLVIPVNPSHKRKIKGIVHDESASGKTVFIEPSEVVEANNRIRELEADERREIIKILTDFTNYLRPFLSDLLESYEFLAKIDFIQAKAAFATLIGGIKPSIDNTPQIDWVEAVHPLLYLSLKKQNRKIVPLDIILEGDNRLLVISGPNAGGKSVCLKTVGLLQYMVQCGLLIPLKENSRVGVFDDIFIDIGDEQSIENDLSTYSSHLLNMKFFEKHCNGKSLLLIDEFGSGTEPRIGAAIAEALLDRFNRRQSFGVITTHYQNLKHFANENKGVVNGAMLYDRHEMQPLFRLAIGNPGSSFAVEIARKTGIPEDVITHASEIVGKDYIDMDKYLQDISRDKRYWERKRDEIRRERKRLEEITSKYEADLETINKQKKEILAQAREQAEQLLAESNARIENTIREIREAGADKEKTKQIRQSLREFKEKIEPVDMPEIKKRKKQKQKQTAGNDNGLKAAQPLAAGDTVRLIGQSSPGEIMEISGKKAVVAFGMIKSTVDLSKLERVSANQIKKEKKASNTRDLLHERKLNFKQDIDVRGMRGDEALQAVMYFVDDAIQLGVSRIRILHGTGTGALRQVIREYLGSVHGVARFQDEHVQFGGTGITVVDLE